MIEDLEKELESKRIKLKALAKNPVDRVWGRQRPAPPLGAVVPHPPRCRQIGRGEAEGPAGGTKKDGQDAVVLTFPDSICWLFNIRGADVAHNPVALAFAIVPASGKPELFVTRPRSDPRPKRILLRSPKSARRQRWSRDSPR